MLSSVLQTPVSSFSARSLESNDSCWRGFRTIAVFSLIQIPKDAGFSPIQYNSCDLTDRSHFFLLACGPPSLTGSVPILLLFALASFSSSLPHLTAADNSSWRTSPLNPHTSCFLANIYMRPYGCTNTETFYQYISWA